MKNRAKRLPIASPSRTADAHWSHAQPKAVLLSALTHARALHLLHNGFGRALFAFRASGTQGLTERRRLGVVTGAQMFVRQTRPAFRLHQDRSLRRHRANEQPAKSEQS